MEIDRTNILNTNYSLSKEFLLTNTNGAYFRTSILGCNTRRSDGLLVVHKNNHDFVLLSSIDEKIIQNGCEYNLAIHKYTGKLNTEGLVYLSEVETNPIPKATYCMGPITFTKELILLSNDDTFLIRYRLKDTDTSIKLIINPLLAMRRVMDLNLADYQKKPEIYNYYRSIVVHSNYGVPDLYIQSSATFTFSRTSYWHYNIEYENDLKSGLKSNEDLYMPGNMEIFVGL